jgi:hypothetical protein
MLFVDPSEVREDTRLVIGELEYQIVPGLEELTGADLMISALSAPASTEQLIRMHLHHNAILVQRKHRTDLVSSLGDRLKFSIFRMRAFGARQSQCMLLFIGVLTCDRNGQAVIDGQGTGHPYWSVYSGLSTWIKHGGVIEPPLSRANLFPDWVRFKVRHIADSNQIPVKEFMPRSELAYEIDPDDPVQELVLIKDWRQTVLCCPGWGIKRVNALRELMIHDKAPDTLLSAIQYMTSDKALQIPGVGKYLVDKAIQWSGKEVVYGKTTKRSVAPPVARAKPRDRRAGHRKDNAMPNRARRKT